MDERLGYNFWKNLDACKGRVSLADLAKKISLNYKSILDQRTSNRLPKLEDAYRIALELNVSVEYLLTGESSSLPAEAKAVMEDESLRLLVRYCMEDRRLLSAIELLVHRVKQDEEKSV